MTIHFGRAPGVAEVIVDRELCNGCGVCVEICKGDPLELRDSGLVVNPGSLFDCMACGACTIYCPMDAIRISGRDLLPEDIFPFEIMVSKSGFAALQQLLLHRRSVRDFSEREVEPELIQQLLDAASTAPMGVPPSEVGVLVFANRKAVGEVRQGLMGLLEGWNWMFSPLFLGLMRPFVTRETYAMFHDFIAPAVKAFRDQNARGVDWFLYDPPLAFYFYGSPVSDPADPIIAATLAMVAAESLGLGSCMLGFPGYLLNYSPQLKKAYGLPKKMQPGIMLVCGYPRYSPQRALKRRFASVKTFEG